MYSFQTIGFRAPDPFNSRIVKMEYRRDDIQPSGLVVPRYLGATMVEVESPNPTESGLSGFLVPSQPVIEQVLTHETDHTSVDSLDELVTSASETWKNLLRNTGDLVGIESTLAEVRKPVEDSTSTLIIAMNMDQALRYADNPPEAATEFVSFVPTQAEQDAINRISASLIPPDASSEDSRGIGLYL